MNLPSGHVPHSGGFASLTPMVVQIKAYAVSTQFYSWHFTISELSAERLRVNEAARKRLEEKADNGQLDSSENFIDADEELTIVKCYLFMLRQFFGLFKSPVLPDEVFGTAASYMKRFFLRNSVIDFHPREIMLTCLYVSCKSAEFPISIDVFAKTIPRNGDRYKSFILNSELFLLEALRYDLWIFTPYRAYTGLVIDLVAYRRHHVEKRSCETKDPNLLTDWTVNEAQLVKDMRTSGIDLIHQWYQTDLCLTAHPSQIALAVLVELGRTRWPTLDVELFIRNEICGCDPIEKPRPACRRKDHRKDANAGSDSGSSTDESVDSSDSGGAGQSKSGPPTNLPSGDEAWTRLWSTLEAIREQVSDFEFVTDFGTFERAEERLEKFRNPLYNIESEEYLAAKESADSLLDIED